MSYTPKIIKNNVNVSSKSPLRELFSLLVLLLGIILIIYIALGLLIDISAKKLPEEIEQNLAKLYKPIYENRNADMALEEKLQGLLDDLAKNIDDKEYTVYLVEDERVNAAALPGRNIIVLSGLLKEIASENELSFVLAHELGHIVHKDNLKALGRRLIFFLLSNIFLGQDSNISNFFGNSLAKAEMKFSQSQEKAADLIAIDLLHQKYNHVGGAVDFLSRLKRKEKSPKLFYFFATHPHSQNRIKKIQERIRMKGYSTKTNTPLDRLLGKKY